MHVPKRFGRPPNWARHLSCEDKKNKQNRWRKNTSHGDRLGVEGFYSRFKRQFGKYVFSRKSGNVEKEIIAKTNLLNFYITS
jgi:aminopeptidase C